MKSGDKVFRIVVLTGLGLVTAAAETVSCGGGSNEGPDSGPGPYDSAIDTNKQNNDGALIGDDASDSSSEAAGDAPFGKDGFPMEGPPMN